MTKKNVLLGVFSAAVIVSMIFAFGLRVGAASNDGSWAWSSGSVTIEATAYKYPAGDVTIGFYAKNENNYRIKIEKFNATAYIGGRSYSGQVGGHYVDAGKKTWIGDLHASWKNSEKVSSVTISGRIEVVRMD
jgi:hypothetical protein